MKTMLLAVIFLNGCAMQQNYTATGGSKSDGTIRLSYEAPGLRDVIVDENQGLQLAISRCKSWGYTGAEEFGGITRVCQMPGGSICPSWLITKEYQCLDKQAHD